MQSCPILLVLCVACDRTGHADVGSARSKPSRALEAVPIEGLCITSGHLSSAGVDTPTFRAVALGHAGDAASLRFRVRGDTQEQRALDSGVLRHQLGLKLRAADGCNLVYVMWRLGPPSRVEVQVKRNPGKQTSQECGAHGYKSVKPRLRETPPALDTVTAHELRAEIAQDTLTAWIDDRVVWQGALPVLARDLAGPAGVRSDNVDIEVLQLGVDARAASDGTATCSVTDRGE